MLATPHSLHSPQVIAAAQRRQACVLREAVRADESRRRSGRGARRRPRSVTLGLGYNRRFHPEMTKLREQVRSGALGTILHVEATMTFPNGLFLKPDAWRAAKDETPCGGADADGRARHRRDDRPVRADSRRCIARASGAWCQVDSDDTTSMLFRMQDGMSGYLGTMTATGPGFSFQVFGSNGLGAAGRDDARGGGLLGGTPDPVVRDVQVSTDQGRGAWSGKRPGSTSRARVSRPSRRPPAAARPSPFPSTR